ncbi:hypothetical protein BCR39DRAFT_323654 [Naematelia encephala]|uniref:Uncharacterized protein n=1 Tax=Naematelia encephala TaxID=71784 RepID=A0A1Y2APD4_9TREE|nr:hypothetical protein BCR39DRAFT_323654 [Naematelia encephala]
MDQKCSSGGFIGLISGIAIFIVITLLIGFYLYNRHRRRFLSNSKRPGLPTLSSLGLGHPSAPSDPYDAPVQPLEEGGPTPLAARLGGRPGYARQRSSEWELPAEPTPTSAARKGKDREWIGVDLPGEPDEAAYPLRSRSPRPVSPRPISPNVSPHGLDNGVSAGRIGNPFDDPYDPSSRIHGIRRSESEKRYSQEDEDDSRTVRSLGDDDDAA